MLLLAIMQGLSVMSAIPTGDHARTVTSSVDGSQQPYRLYVPTSVADGKPMPLLVVLHGKGVDHNAWFDLTTVKRDAERCGYVTAAPNGRGECYYDGDGEQDVLDIIADVRANLRIDPERIYIVGHSMGGWGAWYIALRHPDLFAGVCTMAAVAPPFQMDMLPNARHLTPLIIHCRG